MKIDVSHVAKLANLPLKKEEIKKYEKELSGILEYIDKLKKADTDNTKETSQTANLTNVVAEDKTEPSLSQEEALSQSKDKHNGFFKVKAILNE